MRCTDLAEKPVTTKNYQIYDVRELPKLFLGIKVKNKFDECRLQIKSKYTPKFISHFRLRLELEPFYMYGIEIQIKKPFKSLLKRLNNNTDTAINTDVNEFTSWYKCMLSEYNLSCDTCYRYLSDGLYPIDVMHLDHISKKSYLKEVRSGFKEMMEENNNEWYASLNNLNLFVLGFSTGYNLDYQINSPR
tara:strand:- start:6744 stop:7313 length:570 start_codon:yes stop_codon:yes gene_type:complete